jgi:hypothetical protein
MDELDEIELQMFREELADIMNNDAEVTREFLKGYAQGIAITFAAAVGVAAAYVTFVGLRDRRAKKKFEQELIQKGKPS